MVEARGTRRPAAEGPSLGSDVQGGRDGRNVAIDQVGVRGLRYPVVVATGRDLYSTVATCDLCVDLPADRRGAHMSRFVDVLHRWDRRVTPNGLRDLLREMTRALHASFGRIDMSFPLFVAKRAPVTGIESLMDYDVTLRGEIADDRTEVSARVVVPITSLCPCSKAIADYGAHNQRTQVSVTVALDENLWLEDLIKLVEREGSAELFGLLKRPDEKFVTEQAYDNPKFVEDLVRDVALRLGSDERVTGFRVDVESFESIHNHSVRATVEWPGSAGRRPGGLPASEMTAARQAESLSK